MVLLLRSFKLDVYNKLINPLIFFLLPMSILSSFFCYKLILLSYIIYTLSPIFQPISSLKIDYGPLNIEVKELKVFITSNMITYTHILLVFLIQA